MKRLVLISFATALLVPSLALASPSQAAQPPQPQGTPSVKAAAPKVTDAEFQSFIKAYEALRPIRIKYANELRQTKDKQKQKQIWQEGTKEMKKKVSAYMPVAQYMQVGHAIRTNPALRKRFMQAIGADMHRHPPAARTGS